MGRKRKAQRRGRQPRGGEVSVSGPEAPSTPAGGDAQPPQASAPRTSERDVAAPVVLQPLQAGLGPTDIVSLGHSFRQVTSLIEEVGRTLEAQNQRAQRLMERLEGLARTLEVLPQEAERQLEALDAVQRAIERSSVPTVGLRQELGRGLPALADAVREGGSRIERQLAAASETMAARLLEAQRHAERQQRHTREQWLHAQRRLERQFESGFASLVRNQRRGFALAATVAGACAVLAIGALGFGGWFGGGSSVSADSGGARWRVTAVRQLPTGDASTTIDATDAADGPLGAEPSARR